MTRTENCRIPSRVTSAFKVCHDVRAEGAECVRVTRDTASCNASPESGLKAVYTSRVRVAQLEKRDDRPVREKKGRFLDKEVARKTKCQTDGRGKDKMQEFCDKRGYTVSES